MRRLLRCQRGGVALIMVLAFLSLGTPVVTSTLNLADSLSIDSRTKRDILENDYCALGVAQYVRYLTLTDARWDAWWVSHTISATGVVPVVGKEVLDVAGCEQISFRLQLSGLPGDPPALGVSQLTTSKSVNLASASPNAELEYTIVVANPVTSLRSEDLTAIYDGLPLGFTYVMGTTKLNGNPFGDPGQSLPGKDADQYCIFAENDNLTIEKDKVIPCSVGADDNVTLRQFARIEGNVRAVTGNVDIEKGVVITGDIRAGGNVVLNKDVVVMGTIRAGGNVTIKKESNITVNGNILAGGNVQLRKGNLAGGDVVALTGNAEIRQDSTVQGDVWAKGNADIEQNATMQGNVWSQGNVDLQSGATIASQVIAGGIFTGDQVSVTGGVTQNCQPPTCTIPPVPAWTLFDGSGDRLLLTWDTSGAGVTLNPGDSATLTFKVKASGEGGNYCNQAWADPGGTGTGMTAKVTVRSPSGTQCEGEDVVITTTVDKKVVASDTQPTFTYTTTIKNQGLTDVHISMVRNKLPTGFSYVPSSTKYVLQPSGAEMATLNPSTLITGGKQRLSWYPQPFATSTLGPGETKTLTFQAMPDAALVKGAYRTEAWAFFTEYNSAEAPYTWPTALVQVLDPFEATATDDSSDAIGSFEAWRGTDSDLFRWTIR